MPTDASDLRAVAEKLLRLRQEILDLSPEGCYLFAIPSEHHKIALASIDVALSNLELAACHQAHAIAVSGGGS